MTTSPAAPQKPGFFIRLLRFLLRLLVAILVGLLLGAGMFFGIPAVYRQFIQPVQNHTAQIAALQTSQAGAAAQAASQVEELTSRVNALEKQADADKAALAELAVLKTAQANSEGFLSYQATQSVAQHLIISTLQAGQQNQQTSLDSNSGALNNSLERLSERLTALETAQANSATTQETRDQLGLLRAMQLVLRSEFYLAQSNFGLAAQDAQSAQGLLQDLSNTLPTAQAAQAKEAAAYLKSAAADLPDHPVTANAKLETAWQVLLGYSPTAALTPTPTPPADLTGTTGVTASLTPTPSGTPKP